MGGLKLRLSPLGAADCEALLAATQRSRRLHRPWVYPPTTPAAVQRFAADETPTRERLLLWSSDAGQPALVGYFSIGEIVRGALNGAYLGYWGVSPFAGQGYMSAGLKLLLGHAFRVTRLHRLEANVQPENEASIALVRRAGFSREGFSRRYLKVGGRWRDHERWALTVEVWRSRAKQR